MANPKVATVTNISDKPQTVDEVKEQLRLMKAEIARERAATEAKEAATRELAEKHVTALAELKSAARQRTLDGLEEFKSLASPEELSQLRRDMGMGRKGGKRKSNPCVVCGKTRHSKASTCSGRKSQKQ